MPSLAIEPWGNYSLALAASVECLRVTPWTRACTTPEMLQLGADAAPEFSCISFKAATGHFIKAAMEGAEYGVMVNSLGTCRLRYYRMLQQKLLKERGFNLFIFGLGYDGIKPPLVRYFNPTMSSFLRCCFRARLKVLAVDDLEVAAWTRRALELNAGDTTRVMNACLKDLDQARTVTEIRAFRKSIPGRFRNVPVAAGRRPLKIGLVGEATVLRDRCINHDLEETLGGMGVEVRNFFLLGAEMRNIFNIGLWNRNGRRTLRKLARPYLGTPVGGHAIDSVAHTIRCAQEGYDGVIHVAPSGCMPEISIRPILRRISQDMDIPVYGCSFDEHTSHVGTVTRLEAFVDVLHERRKKKGTHGSGG
jgi:predicted nucleotide-binding protein (sugar kinase/HSP70/actin superfamily)